ncbi:hypothetical protein ACQEV9_07565 [Streptomyces chartreusis]|uniref:hypothetical protein n=1 Tax=Streptomyces chartreusis TaxID=1969 RepID=UPI003D8EA5C2
MTTAQPAWGVITQTVPMAAVTTVVFGYLLAVVLARRQEIGKQRAAAEAVMRQRVRSIRQAVAAAAEHYEQDGPSFEPEFRTPNVGQFTVETVDSAWHLPRRQQRAVRSILATLVGEARVRMAEEFGPSLGTAEHPLGEPFRVMEERREQQEGIPFVPGPDGDLLRPRVDPDYVAATAALSWTVDYSEQTGADYLGLFGQLEIHYNAVCFRVSARPPDVRHKVMPVLAELDKLLALVGGSRKLGERP